jgi:molybdenum cofactor cytidylyltransferase
VVRNKDFAQGMSRSLHLGLSMVHEGFPSVMFLSADQPLVTSTLINSLLTRFWSSDKNICIPMAGGQKGLPTIFSRRYFPDLFDVVGDQGGRDVIGAAANDVLSVELEDPACLMDIDTPADLEALKAQIGPASDLDSNATY